MSEPRDFIESVLSKNAKFPDPEAQRDAVIEYARECDAWASGEAGCCRGRCVLLRDRKGGAMEEWPEDLRVREFPEVRDA